MITDLNTMSESTDHDMPNVLLAYVGIAYNDLVFYSMPEIDRQELRESIVFDIDTSDENDIGRANDRYMRLTYADTEYVSFTYSYNTTRVQWHIGDCSAFDKNTAWEDLPKALDELFNLTCAYRHNSGILDDATWYEVQCEDFDDRIKDRVRWNSTAQDLVAIPNEAIENKTYKLTIDHPHGMDQSDDAIDQAIERACYILTHVFHSPRVKLATMHYRALQRKMFRSRILIVKRKG
jgi:hypothetical protein